MNVFKSHIKGFHRGGHSCSCCVESHSKQLTRRWARHRLKQADRTELARAAVEEVDEIFSGVVEADWDPLHGFEVPDWTEDDEEEEDDYWDELFYLDELYVQSKYAST